MKHEDYQAFIEVTDKLENKFRTDETGCLQERKEDGKWRDTDVNLDLIIWRAALAYVRGEKINLEPLKRTCPYDECPNPYKMRPPCELCSEQNNGSHEGSRW